MTRILSFLSLLFLVPSLASAQLDCIVPTREEGYEANRPNAEAIRRAARAVEAIVKRNALFMAGNEPVRVRTSISYHGDRWLSASVITTAYNKKAWVGEGCQVSKFADRGRRSLGRADRGLHQRSRCEARRQSRRQRPAGAVGASDDRLARARDRGA